MEAGWRLGGGRIVYFAPQEMGHYVIIIFKCLKKKHLILN